MHETLDLMADMMEHHRLEEERLHSVVKPVDHHKVRKFHIFNRMNNRGQK